MARYIKQEMSDMAGDGEKRVFYRMKIEENIDSDQFINEIAYPGSGLNRSIVISVMTAVAEQIARCMANGRSVTIEGIGTFKPKVGVVKNKEVDTLEEGEPKRNAQSLEVNGVNFRADKELVRNTNRRCNLTSGGTSRIKSSPYEEKERLAQALRYLDEHACMHISDYMAITGLKRTSATLELKRFRNDPSSGITFSGWGQHKVYIRKKEGD
ncbi:MAG: HU family DNA-binding protein [Parabacteroides sp.]|nr:HU family DNA-binding protein [Parabacteroides sp.]